MDSITQSTNFKLSLWHYLKSKVLRKIQPCQEVRERYFSRGTNSQLV